MPHKSIKFATPLPKRYIMFVDDYLNSCTVSHARSFGTVLPTSHYCETETPQNTTIFIDTVMQWLRFWFVIRSFLLITANNQSHYKNHSRYNVYTVNGFQFNALCIILLYTYIILLCRCTHCNTVSEFVNNREFFFFFLAVLF